jgi:hypothetical protein
VIISIDQQVLMRGRCDVRLTSGHDFGSVGFETDDAA